MARVFVITGPSGVGKGTLIRGLLERVPELGLSVSATTRPPRPGETQGVDYHFLSPEEFDRRAADGEFVEHATYSGRRYGTLRSELEGRLRRGEPVVLEIEVQGARQVQADDAGSPPGVHRAPVARRAAGAADRPGHRRAGPDRAAHAHRRGGAKAQPEFARVVVNDRLEEATEELARIVGSALSDDGDRRPLVFSPPTNRTAKEL